MKTPMKRALATAALTTMAFAGVAATASAATVRPGGIVHSNRIVHPDCGGPNGCEYEFLAAYLSFSSCNEAGPTVVPAYYSDYYCVEDDFHGPDIKMWDLMVLPY